MKITVCIIARNEEKNIEKALLSIPNSYEIVVLDTGSQDRTKEIAGAYTSHVYEHIWQHDFALARNEAKSYATGQYILMLDADETLGQESVRLIESAVSQYPDHALSVIIQNVDNETAEMTQHRMVRLFPNHPKYRYQGKVHEVLYVHDHAAEIVNSQIVIEHRGYQKGNYHEKFERYKLLYEEHLNQYPNDGYMIYQFGKLYYSIEDWSQACLWFSHCLDLKQEQHLYFPPMLVQCAYAMSHIGMLQEGIALLELYKDQYKYPDIHFALGILYMTSHNSVLMLKSFEKALSVGETTKYTTVPGVGSYRASHNIGLYYEMSGEYEQAMEYYRIGSDLGFSDSKKRLNLLKND